MKPEDFTKIPIALVTQHPTHSCFKEIMINKWWAVTEDDCILLYKRHSWQCNDNRDIVELIIHREGYHPATKAVQLPVVYLQHNCHHYV